MTGERPHNQGVLPERFEELVAMLPPRVIRSEAEYDRTIEMLDWLTSTPRRTDGQDVYMETLMVLVAAYETEHYPI